MTPPPVWPTKLADPLRESQQTGGGVKRVLIVNPFGIGDVIFTMSVVECLRRQRPDLWIGFLCNERTESLVRMNRSLDETIVFNRDLFREQSRKNKIQFLKSVYVFLDRIRSFKIDTLLDLSLGRQYSFFAILIGIQKRIGFNFKGRGIFLTEKINLHGYERRAVSETQMDLLQLLGIPRPTEPLKLSLTVPQTATEEYEAILTRYGISSSEKLIMVAPGGGRSWGANASYKQWDVERFAEAANRFAVATSAKIVVTGDEAESDLVQAFSSKVPTAKFALVGKPLDLVSAFLLHCELLLCNDSGLLHLGNALGTKTVSIFGPVDERAYGPWGGETSREVVTASVPCRPCYKNFHFPPCPYERRCLEEISVENVVEAMHRTDNGA